MAFEYLGLEEIEKAIYYFRKTLEISPKMTKAFEITAKKNGLPEELIKAIIKK